MVLAQGMNLLGDFTVDDEPRTPSVIGDSCVTFNSENQTPEHNGQGMARAYSERQNLWKDKTLQVMILTQDAAKQEHILTLLTTFIASFSYAGNPFQARCPFTAWQKSQP